MALINQLSQVLLPLALILTGLSLLLRMVFPKVVGKVDGKRHFRTGAGIVGALLLTIGLGILIVNIVGVNEPLPSTPTGTSSQVQPNVRATDPGSDLSKSTPAITSVSPWLPEKALEVEIASQKTKGLYPSGLEGRCPKGKAEFRVTFSPIPLKGFEYAYFLEHSEGTFQTASNRMREGGFKLANNQSFTDQTGQIKIQSVWVKP